MVWETEQGEMLIIPPLLDLWPASAHPLLRPFPPTTTLAPELSVPLVYRLRHALRSEFSTSNSFNHVDLTWTTPPIIPASSA